MTRYIGNTYIAGTPTVSGVMAGGTVSIGGTAFVSIRNEEVVTIDKVHYEVHEGELFTSEYVQESVADAGTVRVVMTTGAKQPHFALSVSAGGACRVYMHENSTSVGGTAVPIYNNNRLSANTPSASIVHSPSAGTAGTVALINGRYIPGGASVQTRVGGGVRTGVEYGLGTAQKYIIDIVNRSGGTIIVDTILEWYEEIV